MCLWLAGFFFFLTDLWWGEPTLKREPGCWTGNKDAGVAFFEVPVTHEQGKCQSVSWPINQVYGVRSSDLQGAGRAVVEIALRVALGSLGPAALDFGSGTAVRKQTYTWAG